MERQELPSLAFWQQWLNTQPKTMVMPFSEDGPDEPYLGFCCSTLVSRTAAPVALLVSPSSLIRLGHIKFNGHGQPKVLLQDEIVRAEFVPMYPSREPIPFAAALICDAVPWPPSDIDNQRIRGLPRADSIRHALLFGV